MRWAIKFLLMRLFFGLKERRRPRYFRWKNNSNTKNKAARNYNINRSIEFRAFKSQQMIHVHEIGRHMNETNERRFLCRFNGARTSIDLNWATLERPHRCRRRRQWWLPLFLFSFSPLSPSWFIHIFGWFRSFFFLPSCNRKYAHFSSPVIWLLVFASQAKYIVHALQKHMFSYS